MLPEDILKHREAFAIGAGQYQHASASGHNAYGAFILRDNTLGTVGPWVCHGWLKDETFPEYLRQDNLNLRLRRGASPVYILSAVMHLHTSKEFARSYIHWLVNESNWAEVFVDKDADSIMRLGYLVDANKPSNLIASAFVASRFLTESYTGTEQLLLRHKVYEKLLTLGCSRNEAFMFCHMYTPEVSKKFYPIVPMLFKTGHTPFSYSGVTQAVVKNFLTNNRVGLSTHTIAERVGYSSNSISAVWGSVTTPDANSFWTKVMAIAPAKATKSVDHNIFRKIKVNGVSFSSDEDFLSVINQLRAIVHA